MVEPVSTTVLLGLLAGSAIGSAGFGIFQAGRAEEEAEKTAKDIERKRIIRVREEAGVRAQRLSILGAGQPQTRKAATGLIGEKLSATPNQSVLSAINPKSTTGGAGTAGTF